MTVFNRNTQCLPCAKLFDADGNELHDDIFSIDTVTGDYKSYKRDAEGLIIVEPDIAIRYGVAIPPITIKWSENRIRYRLKMAWYVFELKVSCWWRTGDWPKRNKPKGFIKD